MGRVDGGDRDEGSVEMGTELMAGIEMRVV
jgi:hypothetical protein